MQSALKVAIDLVHIPSRVRLLRSKPLPQGIPLLLRIASGDEDAEREAVERTGRSLEVVRAAASFFIEQILFCPGADSYRILGATPDATGSELRRNMSLLLQWLHPDMDRREERSIFLTRVTTAWNDLKTPERRALYDDERRAHTAKRVASRIARAKRPGQAGYPSDKRFKNALKKTHMFGLERNFHRHKGEKHGILFRVWFFLLGRTKF